MTSLQEIYQGWQEEENKITLEWVDNKEQLLQKINAYLPENFRAEWGEERENIRIINGDGLITNFPCHILPEFPDSRRNPYMVKFDEFCEKYRAPFKLDILEIVFSPEEIFGAIRRDLPERYSASLEQMPDCYASLKPNEVPWSLNFMDNWLSKQAFSQVFTHHEYNFYEAKSLKTWALNKIAEHEKKHKLSYSKERLMEML